jgi:hypothetical protein
VGTVMTTPEGAEFEVHVDDAGRIARVAGPWPDEEGAEFELHGQVPSHVPIEDAPAHVHEFAAARGRHVCSYDPDGCTTCFCDADDNVLYCRKMC